MLFEHVQRTFHEPHTPGVQVSTDDCRTVTRQCLDKRTRLTRTTRAEALQEGRTDKTEDVVKKGDMVKVKLLSIDEKGKMRLSRKAAMMEEKSAAEPAAEE